MPSLFRELSIADWITLIGAFSGSSAILFCLNYLSNDRKLPYLDMSFICFPIALMADILDGRVARSDGKNRKSLYGGDLDSLSDIISFGLAPSVLAFTLGMTGMWDGIFFCINIICGVARLARYNVTSERLTDPKLGKITHFEGLPIPGNLILVVILCIDHYFANNYLTTNLYFKFLSKTVHPFSICYFIFGLFMISTIHVPKF